MANIKSAKKRILVDRRQWQPEIKQSSLKLRQLSKSVDAAIAAKETRTLLLRL